jgi:hypothetical protein
MSPSNLLNLLQKISWWIQRSHWDRGIRSLQTIIANISANSKPITKRL